MACKASAVYYAMANLSIRLSTTLRYCVKTRECRGMQSSLSRSPASFSDAKNGRWGRPCPGKIWLQRGRPHAKTAELYTFRLIIAEVDSEKSSINATRKLTMAFPTRHEPRSSVTPNFSKVQNMVQIPKFCINFDKKHQKSGTKYHCQKLPAAKLMRDQLPIARYYGTGWHRSQLCSGNGSDIIKQIIDRFRV